MEYVIPKVPTADEIAAMTDEQKQTIQAELERVMLLEADRYKKWEADRVERQAQFDAAYSAWKEANQSLFDDVDEAKLEAQLAKDFMQSAAVARRLLTGDKTWKAFQAAESWKPEYDQQAIYEWALRYAPGMIRDRILSLNIKEVDKLVLERINEAGMTTAFEATPAMPAIAKRIYTGKVLMKELAALPVSESKPIEIKMMAEGQSSIIKPIGPQVTINVTDPIRLLTQDEVRKDQVTSELDILLKPTENALVKLAETPTPVDPIPAVVTDDEIPF